MMVKGFRPFSNIYVFKTLNEVRAITENWLRQYNVKRPHDSLEDLTPLEYLNKYQSAEIFDWM
ncbi:MAG: transposase [Pseudomonadales bacterium]|nr:transposase [Pseudomonadales bacterium]